jgi:hypothetical protein
MSRAVAHGDGIYIPFLLGDKMVAYGKRLSPTCGSRRRWRRPAELRTQTKPPAIVFSSLLVHSFCMQHQVTWCGPLAAVDSTCESRRR